MQRSAARRQRKKQDAFTQELERTAKLETFARNLADATRHPGSALSPEFLRDMLVDMARHMPGGYMTFLLVWKHLDPESFFAMVEAATKTYSKLARLRMLH